MIMIPSYPGPNKIDLILAKKILILINEIIYKFGNLNEYMKNLSIFNSILFHLIRFIMIRISRI
jgi:hypothetical protein